MKQMDILFSGFLLVLAAVLISAQATAQSAETLYQQNCASCHDNPDGRVPSREALAGFNPNSIFHALDVGIMQTQAASLNQQQKILLAEFLTGASYSRDRMERLTACMNSIGELDLTASANWNGWANGVGSPRHQGVQGSNITKNNIDRLTVAWSFGVEGASSARGAPAIIDGVVIMGSPSGVVYAMDLESGCNYWTYPAIAEVRAAPTIVAAPELDRTLVIIADQSNRVYALDIKTGEKIWHSDPDDNPWAVSTGAPVVHDGKVFVPVSSMEVAGAGNPEHECCTFRGNVAALDLNSGEKLWHTFIMDEPQLVGSNSLSNNVYAPSGAPIWDAPTLDPERNRIYLGSGQNYSRPTSHTSDAILAFNMDSGNIDWVHQTRANDAFTMACTGSDHPNCPQAGPDLDIGASILSTTLSNGQDILIAGSKGAVVFGLDPDADGEVIWQTRVGKGSPLGGIHWGMTFVGDTVYAPVSDRIPSAGRAAAQPGLHALDMKTGAVLWYVEAPDRCEGEGFSCSNSYSAAPTATDDMVIAGALNGVLFAHDKDSGEIIWEWDSKQEYSSVNNVPAKGGAFDATGPVLSGDYMIVNSGYGGFGQIGGNAMVVLKLAD